MKQNCVDEPDTSVSNREEYHKQRRRFGIVHGCIVRTVTTASVPIFNKQCHGSISKDVWKNPKTRLPACAAVIKEKPQQFDAPILFCLLNSQTEKLCQQIPVCREEIRAILCKAAGFVLTLISFTHLQRLTCGIRSSLEPVCKIFTKCTCQKIVQNH